MALTPEQVLRVAVAAILDDVDQSKLASLMGVNQGRINEAVKAIEWTMANHRTAYKLARGQAQVVISGGNGEGVD